MEFYKYQGAGNDFVIIDNRERRFDADNVALVARLCDRRFGIGADGLMLLQDHTNYDFEMRYFNADGREASMCGNGGRCMVAFASRVGIIGDKTTFMAVDGVHEACVVANNLIDLKMIDVSAIEHGEDYFFLNTGSPHVVRFVNDLEGFDVVGEGRKIRYNERFKDEGTNVNFAEFKGDLLYVYTYERGVEDETLACGTGITAAALCAGIRSAKERGRINVKAKGGSLSVSFIKKGEDFENIWLKGPADFVFKGSM